MTIGVNGAQGIYSSWSALAPRRQPGLHGPAPARWAFEGTETHYGDVIGGDSDPQRYEPGMIVHMSRGRGEAFTARSCEWIMGLARRDFCMQQITRNARDRFLGRRSSSLAVLATG